MSRKNRRLKGLNGARLRFRAQIGRFGTQVDYRNNRSTKVLLTNVIRADTGESICDHAWVTQGKSFPRISEGDAIEFEASIATYIKGHVNRRKMVDTRSRDYGLTHPSNITIL